MAAPTCPYCFSTIPSSAKWAFRCLTVDERRCRQEDDKALQNYERAPSPRRLPRVFEAPRRPGGAICSCGTPTTKRLCPHCHNELPSEFGDTESLTIALIGEKEVGKSQYIAVLINELSNRVGSDFGASMSASDEQTRKRYRDYFRRHLYENSEVVPATLPAAAALETRLPLIYRFSLEQKRLGFFKSIQVSSLSFFDAAGEDLAHIDSVSTEARYIAKCDGLIFLLDPLQIPSVRERVSRDVPLPHNESDMVDIATRVAKLHRAVNNLHATAKVRTPVALAFSKIDAVLPLFSPASGLHAASRHEGSLDLDDVERTNADVSAQVIEWRGDDLHRFMGLNFENFSYFGVSALGSPPSADGRLSGPVSPFRVADPFLWLLYKAGLIKGQRRARS